MSSLPTFSPIHKISQGPALTPFTRSTPEPSASAVADEAVPTILAHSIVLTGVAVTLLGVHSNAGRFDPRRILLLCQLPDILAPPINEEISDAAHIAIVQHGSPELSREDKACPVLRKPSQVHIPFQIQDFTLSACSERGPSAVD